MLGTHLGALHKGEAALLASDDGDGAADLAQGLPRVVLDQAPDQQRLAHLQPAQRRYPLPERRRRCVLDNGAGG